jgi:hypothetical protein
VLFTTYKRLKKALKKLPDRDAVVPGRGVPGSPSTEQRAFIAAIDNSLALMVRERDTCSPV